jgi:hypothetical protein
MELENNELLTFDNISKLGFEYNYFEGYTYQHKDGFSISVYNVNEIRYKAKTYNCKTAGDFRALANSL